MDLFNVKYYCLIFIQYLIELAKSKKEKKQLFVDLEIYEKDLINYNELDELGEMHIVAIYNMLINIECKLNGTTLIKSYEMYDSQKDYKRKWKCYSVLNDK